MLIQWTNFISKAVRNLIMAFLISGMIVSCKSDSKKTSEASTSENLIQPVKSPVTGNSSLPRLFSNERALYMSWVEQKDSSSHLKYSVLQNDNWTADSTIISGSDWFVNWADFPAIAEVGGNLLSHVLKKSDTGTYTYDVKLNLYANSQWKKDFKLHSDFTKSEHGFVTIKPYVGNSFMVTWLDGRNAGSGGHGAHKQEGAMSLRAAIVFETGVIDYDTLLDERVCDCCQTTAAIGPNDEIIIAYRDRSEDEIRDISVVRWEMETGWSQPQTIGNDQWKIEGCPVNGPSMDAFGKNIALAWFTAHSGEGEVNLVFSNDVGKSFSEPIRIDSGNATGRVDVSMINENEAAILWMEPMGEKEVIQLMKVNLDGSKNTPLTVSEISPERASGFPQLEKLGDQLYVAWTMVNEQDKSVEIAKIAIDQL